jgi:uncharacterized membrane protein YgcG
MKPNTSLTNTNVFKRLAAISTIRAAQQSLACVLAFALLLPMLPQSLAAAQDQDAQAPAQPSQAPPYTQQTPDQLQQLVAPIALYPDSLVAQVLAASTFPAEIVEADRYVQANPDLKGDALAKAVDQQSWDPSVKALTAFPTVLGNMDKNISWTSSLGDAYYNQEQGVMDAIQVMRQKAQQAGNLKDTPQQTVQTQGSDIVIQPASPDVVYVPAYDPWLVYGYPVVAWPGWYPYPGIWWGGPSLYWGGIGFGIGFYGGYGWGWGHWGVGWGGRNVIYNNNRYYSRSNTFYNRNNYYRGGGERGVANNVHGGGERGAANNVRGGDARGNAGSVYNRPGGKDTPFHGNTQAARGFDQSRGQTGTRSSGFSGYDHGGEARSYSSRGSSSFGGGGGGFHGGGGGGGGGHHR